MTSDFERAFVTDQPSDGSDRPEERLSRILRAVRTHLGMDVGFISEFTKGYRVFRHVDSRATPPIQVGGSDPLEDTYCQWVVDGRLPNLIPNTTDLPATRELSATAALPVGAHMSVPITLKDGSTYGTFCCFSPNPDPSLNDRDLNLLHLFADLAADQIDHELEAARSKREIERRVRSALDQEALTMVYQPICEMRSGRIAGFESLARFTKEPVRSPDVWFDEAHSVGLGVELELRAIEMSLRAIRELGAHVYVSINASPETIVSRELSNALIGVPLDKVVLEVTEHSAVNEYRSIIDATRPLRDRGLRLAIDDAGAGHASFRHVLNLAPDIIKLDMSITRGIDSDRSRRTLAAALVGFAREMSSTITAEGVETAEEYAVLGQLGIDAAQGYFLGKPLPRARWEQLQEMPTGGTCRALGLRFASPC